MERNDAFSTLHPGILFFYFALVFVFSMFLMHPVCLLLSAVLALCYAAALGTAQTVRFALPMLLLTLIVNPAFNHEGASILLYLPGGNPLTQESILYGAASGMMLFSVICWFACFSRVMTSEKFVYLFGRILPSLSLVLSMALRFIPKFKTQFSAVRSAQKAIGRDLSDGTVFVRLQNAVHIFSILLTWSLENAIETADSMKSRGYGLSRRTAFSIFRFDGRDGRMLLWLTVCAAVLCGAWALGAFSFRYFPTVRAGENFPVCFLVYAALLATPLVINFSENTLWKNSRSAI